MTRPGAWPSFLLGVFLSLFGYGCAPSPADVVGTYGGNLHGAHENLVLRADGTLTQKLLLPDGRAFITNGTWSLENVAVELSHYVHFIDEAKGTLTEPRTTDSILYEWGAGTLSRECTGGDYVLKRESP